MEKQQKAVNESKRYAFIAEHRGGPLSKENHTKLCKWARECAGHVLHLINSNIDLRLINALNVAQEWEDEKRPTGEAMKASLAAHSVARETKDPILKAIARSIGQTVATAHMADHSLGGAYYALKAMKIAGKDIIKEKEWQWNKLAELPPEVIEIVEAAWKVKELDRRI